MKLSKSSSLSFGISNFPPGNPRGISASGTSANGPSCFCREHNSFSNSSNRSMCVRIVKLNKIWSFLQKVVTCHDKTSKINMVSKLLTIRPAFVNSFFPSCLPSLDFETALFFILTSLSICLTRGSSDNLEAFCRRTFKSAFNHWQSLHPLMSKTSAGFFDILQDSK